MALPHPTTPHARPLRPRLIALAALACMATGAHAQTAAGPEAAETTLLPVTVSGARDAGYAARSAQIGLPGQSDEARITDLPVSVNVVTRQLLDDRQSRLLSDVVRTDASVGEYYAALGYYENFSIRGFTMDLATSLRLNGAPLTGEQNVALENKDRVEILKGVGALQAGATAPGGLINYVTRRPAEVRTLTLGTGERGNRLASADLGGWFGTDQQFGVRVNLAHEDLRPYVKGAEGERQFASLAFDWKISSRTALQFDAEYQKKRQKSVPGLMLLGDRVPGGIDADVMLSNQPWVQPVRTGALNTTLRLDHEFDRGLQGFVQLSRSQARIDDYTAYPYGCAAEASATFCSDGRYDVWDFRSEGELRRNDQLQAGLNGQLEAGGLKHQWTAGYTRFQRAVHKGNSVFGEWDEEGGYGYANGTDSIYNPGGTAVSPTTSYGTGPVHRIFAHRQHGLFAHGQIGITPALKLFVGGRQVWMRERTFEVVDGSALDDRRNQWFLPQLGLTWQLRPGLSAYASYSKGLELGTIPLKDSFRNYREIFEPRVTQQYEAGLRLQREQLFASLVLFRASKPNEYASGYSTDDYKSTLTQDGRQTNTGLEATLGGQVAPRLRMTGSAMWLQARLSEATVDPSQNGNQAIGIPRLRAVAFADYSVPGVEGLSTQLGWSYTSAKAVTLDNSVSVPGFHKFDAGLRYQSKLGGNSVVYRLAVENLFNQFYWRDVSQTYGANTLYPGAPRLWRASAQFSF